MTKLLAITVSLFLASPATAQPGAPQPQPPPPQPQPPPPQPYPAPPPPQPYPYPPPPQPYSPPPQQVAAPRPEEPPPESGVSPDDWASFVAFFHGLCPDGANPKCSGGIWLGLRGLYINGPAEQPIGLAVDLKAGFGFGFGFEIKGHPRPGMVDHRETAAHVMTGGEIGVGPGLRLGGMLDVVPIVGIGADALAYGFTGSDDEATSEAFWYASGAAQLHLGGMDVTGSAARQYRDAWDRYADRIEVGCTWKTDKKARFGFTVWWIDYDRFTVAGGGLVAGPLDQSSSGK